MSTPPDEATPELSYAEYVLGVLDADGGAEIERQMAADPAVTAAVQQWRRRLLPLAEEVAPEVPAAHLWQRIVRELRLDLPAPAVQRAPAGRADRAGQSAQLRFWQRLALASSALLAAACVAIVVLIVRRPVPPPIPYMASSIAEAGGRVAWTATMDLAKARMIVVPASPGAVGPGRSAELWLIPRGGKPIAVGIISTTASVAIQLPPTLLARLGPTATLAVSVERLGGSPTGQPGGPVIATGSIGAAAAGGAAPATATAMRSTAGTTHG